MQGCPGASKAGVIGELHTDTQPLESGANRYGVAHGNVLCKTSQGPGSPQVHGQHSMMSEISRTPSEPRGVWDAGNVGFKRQFLYLFLGEARVYFLGIDP